MFVAICRDLSGFNLQYTANNLGFIACCGTSTVRLCRTSIPAE
jgi:hypothetical protein